MTAEARPSLRAGWCPGAAELTVPEVGARGAVGEPAVCFSLLQAGPEQPFTEQNEESENPNPSLSLPGHLPDVWPCKMN